MPSLHSVDLTHRPSTPSVTRFTFGTAKNPAGMEIAADGVSLLESEERVTPVMGEIHYARLPRAEWRDALLKMKAGGIDVVATYVFWIHHEEAEGQWDWSADRDLSAFVTLCGALGLKCVIRIGPWCHGEVRNGGLPEWLIDNLQDVALLRTNEPRYLKEVQRFYNQIAQQLRGRLWKDGGPVIGVQIENEYAGHPDHLLTLKRMAIDTGLDVPLYTRTGWPELQSPMPFGQLLPLFGGYAEGFWDRELSSMPGHYWKEFIFKTVRTDAAIASEHFGEREVEDAPDTANYPYLTCEIGPGMPCSYHRRITVFPRDVLSMMMVKLGSGSNSPGYYMYHGGTNPVGREPWLQEHQSTQFTNWNDLPVKSYDFQTCLGEFGQVREQYHLLRPVHLFLREFGERLAGMAAVLPAEKLNKDDTQTLRWAVRTDGRNGFVFINNYQRLLPLPARENVQLKLRLKDGELTFPQEPVTVAADSAFFWPFNLDLGDGITLRSATAQPICQVRDEGTVYSVFARTNNRAELIFAGHASAAGGGAERSGESIRLENPPAGTAPVVTLVAKNGVTHQVLLLDEQSANACYKGFVAGRERLVLTSANVIFDNGNLRLSTADRSDVSLSLLPPPASLRLDGESLSPVAHGVFARFVVLRRALDPVVATVEHVREAGTLRTIPIGAKNVASAPTDADFDAAAVWRITFPADTDCSRRLLLRIAYSGDVARAYLGDALLTDNFYNGTPFEIGLNRFGPEVFKRGITLKILPLQKGAPIHMLDRVRPDFAGRPGIASVLEVEVVETCELCLHAT